MIYSCWTIGTTSWNAQIGFQNGSCHFTVLALCRGPSFSAFLLGLFICPFTFIIFDSWQEVVFPCPCGLRFPVSVGLLSPSLVKYLLSLVGISFSQAFTMVEWADMSDGIGLKGISECRVYLYFYLEPEKSQTNWDWMVVTFMVAKMIPGMMDLYDFRV